MSTMTLEQAMRRAFSLGQTYWQQADSESYSQNKKASATAAKFDDLLRETLDAHRAQPAQAVDVGAGFHAMNRALCDFAMRWEIDGDYMRCRKCKRPQITNYASHDFPHSADCKAAGKVETRPWETFAQLMAPLTRALSGEKAGWRLVPEIATPAMVDAGRAARPDGQFTGQCGEVYRAMLAASPTPDKE